MNIKALLISAVLLCSFTQAQQQSTNATVADGSFCQRNLDCYKSGNSTSQNQTLCCAGKAQVLNSFVQFQCKTIGKDGTAVDSSYKCLNATQTYLDQCNLETGYTQCTNNVTKEAVCGTSKTFGIYYANSKYNC